MQEEVNELVPFLLPVLGEELLKNISRGYTVCFNLKLTYSIHLGSPWIERRTWQYRAT